MKLVKYNSPNHFNGRAGHKADMICFHQTGGNELAPALNWYLNPGSQCSPNYVIDKDGTIYQLVDLANGAWCNGTSNNPADDKFYGYSLSSIVKSRPYNSNYYTVSIEFVHSAYGNIEQAQKDAAVELIATVILPYIVTTGITPQIDREHFVGHSDITPKTRPNGSCPGRMFPYDEIIGRVRDYNKPKPQQKTVEKVHYIGLSLGQAAIRTGTSKSAAITARVTKGDYYLFDRYITEVDGSIWLRHKDKNLYSMYADGGKLFQILKKYNIFHTTAKLNVRKEPTIKSEIISVLEQNQPVYAFDEATVVKNKYHWLRIVLDGKVGYVASEYLK